MKELKQLISELEDALRRSISISSLPYLRTITLHETDLKDVIYYLKRLSERNQIAKTGHIEMTAFLKRRAESRKKQKDK